jgi:hypothetical protein
MPQGSLAERPNAHGIDAAGLSRARAVASRHPRRALCIGGAARRADTPETRERLPTGRIVAARIAERVGAIHVGARVVHPAARDDRDRKEREEATPVQRQRGFPSRGSKQKPALAVFLPYTPAGAAGVDLYLGLVVCLRQVRSVAGALHSVEDARRKQKLPSAPRWGRAVLPALRHCSNESTSAPEVTRRPRRRASPGRREQTGFGDRSSAARRIRFDSVWRRARPRSSLWADFSCGLSTKR